jgi:hypothetical protein
MLVERDYVVFSPTCAAGRSSRKRGPAWDYEFGCMLAGDSTEQGSVLKAWEAIPSPVKKGFWEGANIYVMIVRGASSFEGSG